MCWWNSFWLVDQMSVAKGVVQRSRLGSALFGFCGSGALLIVHPGAESKMNELIRPKSTVQLPLFIGA